MSDLVYNVRILPKSGSGRVEYQWGLLEAGLQELVVQPYSSGQPLVLEGRIISPNEVERITIMQVTEDEFTRKPSFLGRIRYGYIHDPTGHFFRERGVDVTEEFINGPPGSVMTAVANANQPSPAKDNRNVFVIHGRNNHARDALFAFLRSIDLHPLEWSEAVQSTGKASPYIGEILDSAFSRAHAVVALFTPDDEARLREPYRKANELIEETQLRGQARPNILFESGMALARHEDRTVLAELGDLRPFSDVAGRHAIRIDNSPGWRQDLAQRLETAGCPVRRTGSDWLTAGDFGAVLSTLSEEEAELSRTDLGQPSGPNPVQLSSDAQALLLDASTDQSGMLLAFGTMGGKTITTNGKEFGDRGNARSEARWEQALLELVSYGFVKDPKGKGEVFEVTHSGYLFADALNGSEPQESEEESP